MIPRLDDFTSKELDVLLKAVIFRLTYIDLNPDPRTLEEIEPLNLMRTQIVNATVTVLLRRKGSQQLI